MMILEKAKEMKLNYKKHLVKVLFIIFYYLYESLTYSFLTISVNCSNNFESAKMNLLSVNKFNRNS